MTKLTPSQREQELKAKLTPNLNIGEKDIFTALCVVINVTAKTKIGAGMAQVLQNETNHRYRLLIRSANDLNSEIVNCFILPHFNIRSVASSRKSYQIEIMNYINNKYEQGTYALFFINEETARLFMDNFLNGRNSNSQLLGIRK